MGPFVTLLVLVMLSGAAAYAAYKYVAWAVNNAKPR